MEDIIEIKDGSGKTCFTIPNGGFIRIPSIGVCCVQQSPDKMSFRVTLTRSRREVFFPYTAEEFGRIVNPKGNRVTFVHNGGCYENDG
jgi:hypothetical protein